MSKLSDIFGRKGGETGADKHAERSNGKRSNDDADHIAVEHYAAGGSRIAKKTRRCAICWTTPGARSANWTISRPPSTRSSPRSTIRCVRSKKIQQLTERSGHLEADNQVSRTNIEKRVEDLNSSSKRERVECAVIDGALEPAREDNSRLQSEIGALRCG